MILQKYKKNLSIYPTFSKIFYYVTRSSRISRIQIKTRTFFFFSHGVFICSVSAALCLFALADEWQLLHIGGLSCSEPLDHGKKGAVKGPLSPLQSQEQAIAG